MPAKIQGVVSGSIADKHGVRKGDIITKINGRPVCDYLDYMFLTANEEISLELSDRTLSIINEDFEPLGIEFDTLLIDDPKSCLNKCIFCFIDQLPKNMRESCYFKDDDYRLSFLQGNYVTLTNMKDEEIDRIIEYNLPRINVSVHTTNPELRVLMLRNKNAGKIMQQIQKFADNEMVINCQVVLCRDYNDGEELDRTISDLASFGDCIESLSIVPVGISAYRDGLTPLKSFDKESSLSVISQVEKWQRKFREERGINFVYLADEFYIMADAQIPEKEEYDAFPQIENGVGLCSSFKWEFDEALNDCRKIKVKSRKTVVTGVLAYDFIKELVEKLGSDKISVEKINNNFFGEKITVSGLVTGGDIIKQLEGRDIGKSILIPNSMLRHNEEVFLDNITISDVEKALNVRVIPVENDGFSFFDELIK